MSKLIPGVLLLLLGGVSAFSQQPPPNADGQAAAQRNPTGALRQIIPGHYVYSSGTYNSGIIVNAGIRHATGNGRPAAVSATNRQAPIRVAVSTAATPARRKNRLSGKCLTC